MQTTSNRSASAVASAPAVNPNWPSYIATTDASNAPYEFRDANGEIIGFDADLIYAIAREQQFNVSITARPWAGIFNALNTGEPHIVIAPLTITPERREQVTFTIPYIYPTRSAYLTAETAKRLGIHHYADLPKATIAAKKNTTNISSLENDFGQDRLKLLPTDTQYLAFTAMIGKEADVAFGDSAVLRYHHSLLNNMPFNIIEQPLKTPVEAGFAVKKGNDALAETLNMGIHKVVASGEYRRLAIKWFGDELGTQIANKTESALKRER